MIERAGFWRRAVAAAVDTALAILVFQVGIVLLSAATGGRVATNLGLYTVCQPADDLPRGVVLPPDFAGSRQQICTSSLFGAPLRSLFVATRQSGAGPVQDTTQFVAPVSPNGRAAIRVLFLDLLLNPLFLLLRWATDRFWRASPGRRLMGIAVTAADGTVSGAERANLLAMRYWRFSWIYLPGSLFLAVAAGYGAVTGTVPPLAGALAWFSGSVWAGAAHIAAAMAMIRRRDTFYDAPVGSAVATRVEIARLADMVPDARPAPLPGPVDDLRRALRRARARVPLASCALVAVMIVVFAGEILFEIVPALPASVAPDTLAAWGGTDRELVLLCWQPYRLLAAIFVHANTTHLVVNALALVVIGALLEPWLGRALFVLAFLACGIAGSIASIAVNPPQVISVGASGAVLGLFAAAFALAWRIRPGRQRYWFLAWPLVVCPAAVVPGVKLPDGLMVDIPDHVGGELAGLLVGLLVVLAWRHGTVRRPSRRATLVAGGFAATVLVVPMAFGGLRPPSQTVSLVPPGEAPTDDLAWALRGEALSARYPDDPRARFGLAMAEAETGSAAQAIADLEAAVSMQQRLSPAGAGRFRFAAHAQLGARFFGTGDLDDAIAQYTAALAAQPQAAVYRQRGISEFYRGRGAEAVADLRQAVLTDGKEPYSVLWLSIVAVRTGQEDPIAATAHEVEGDAWPAQVIRFFDGTMRHDVMEAEAGALDLVSDQHRTCEAAFYTAESDLKRGETDAARPLLQGTVSTCPKTFVEYRAALEELAGHGGSAPR